MVRIPRKLAGIGAADIPDADAFDAYIGPAREITVDQERGIITLHDGITPGGYQFRKDVLDWVNEVGGDQTLTGNKTFSNNVTVSGTFTAAANNLTGTLPAGALPNHSAALLTSGTVADARLSSNVVMTSGNQTITGTKTFNGAIRGNAVTQTQVDTTAGRLTKVGDFGWGVPGTGGEVASPPIVADVDDSLLPTGLFRVDNSTAGTLPPGGSTSSFLHYRHVGGWTGQVGFSRGDGTFRGELSHRAYNANTGWMSWSRIWSELNLNIGGTGNGDVRTNQQNDARFQPASVQLTNIATGDGSGLTNLPAGNLTGTVAGARLGGNQTMAGNKTFSGNVTVNGTLTAAANNLTGTLPAGVLPNHSAALLTSGTLPVERLPTNNAARDWVGDRTADLAFGSVGSYVLAGRYENPEADAPGSLVAGGALRPSNADGTGLGLNSELSGTWMTMGQTYNTPDQSRITLRLRVNPV